MMATFEQDLVNAGKRWRSMAAAIARTINVGPVADTPARKDAFLRHQIETAGGAALWAGVAAPPEYQQVGRESVIGDNDFISYDAMQKALAIGRFVGLVCRKEAGRAPGNEFAPIATGSMVSPRLLLTNNHVLASAEEAAGAIVKFDYVLGEDQQPLPTSAFEFRPDEFFATNETLDYTLVAVAQTASEGTPLANFGWNRLNGAEGKILKGHRVNIIQHPEGGYKQFVFSGNRVLELFEHYFLYDADTLPGSSGSPVFNTQWEIVALHRRGVPKLADGQIVTTGGQVWNKGIPKSSIAWIGNEGTRVSSLVGDIQSLVLAPTQDRLRRELIDTPAPNPFRVSQQALGQRPAMPVAPAPSGNVHQTLRMKVPVDLEFEIKIGIGIDPSSGGGGPGG